MAVLNRAFGNTVVLLDKRQGEVWSKIVCAAVRVGPKVLLTANHCAIAGSWTADELANFEDEESAPIVGREMRFVNFSGYNGYRIDEAQQVSAIVLAGDQKRDVAILYTEDEAATWAIVRSIPAQLDEEVFTIGHPSGYLYHLTRGRVGADRRRQTGGWFSHVDITIYYGNSGGGLFDSEGRVIGIASAFSSSSSAFFVHQEAIEELVERTIRVVRSAQLTF